MSDLGDAVGIGSRATSRLQEPAASRQQVAQESIGRSSTRKEAEGAT